MEVRRTNLFTKVRESYGGRLVDWSKEGIEIASSCSVGMRDRALSNEHQHIDDKKQTNIVSLKDLL